ncbi:cysteine proteinase inhibitor A-like [Amaranthus tricolor]|uniref:cysteine proteinase inhibitor A-like n=1 Tax=Amaranthus tricolor TaxID=29722 RepID=UPI00258EF33A|nr:cysteine proteinase inhibitor A-like [Amaranthus tricolor]
MSCNSQKNKPGSRVPIDPKSAKIQELGVWAVNQYNNKKKACLKFENALKAEQEMVAGMLYYIDVEASDGGPIPFVGKYEAKVFVEEWNNIMKLEEFKPMLQDHGTILVPN